MVRFMTDGSVRVVTRPFIASTASDWRDGSVDRLASAIQSNIDEAALPSSLQA
jgi:hypothetical protein